jgi:hypothetical protein
MPGQILGRATMGCEGTHSVFPKCNFTCKPCYHSRDANHVRVDGRHTLAEVEKQMRYLQEQRGSGVHCQLIGGEVSLLDADDHGRALEVMRRFGRIPMSFTNGDFDYEYLLGVATRRDGSRRFGRITFAVHFDRFMFGRRRIKRPKSEQSLNPFRQKFCDMFHRLKRESVVDSFFLAHNMTVTPGNVDEIPDIIRSCRAQGWSLMSHQPAAFVGDEARWNQSFRSIDPEKVWQKIEVSGGGRGAHHCTHSFQHQRKASAARCRTMCFRWATCGATAACGESGWATRTSPIPRTHQTMQRSGSDERNVLATYVWVQLRDMYLDKLGPIQLSDPSVPMFIPVIRAIRIILSDPFVCLPLLVSFLWRTMRRIGAISLLTQRVHPMTFVMHNFMDAESVKLASALNATNEWSADPKIKGERLLVGFGIPLTASCYTQETQERLKACSYTFGHPETGELVPACVQHSVLDPGMNAKLRTLLPLLEEQSCCSEALDW